MAKLALRSPACRSTASITVDCQQRVACNCNARSNRREGEVISKQIRKLMGCRPGKGSMHGSGPNSAIGHPVSGSSPATQSEQPAPSPRVPNKATENCHSATQNCGQVTPSHSAG
ncbi:hypothetical protein CONLIGDRAFT_277875 [Coniochaeta ligniaria NRRL 30616]|uniref:Uncharacterized protein n=1 Tax=Coniochaeta ligniaria NRRL 30616 TaxID=1408157 RepID=A0A1J7JY62_9PEZI|nr:hypothetical protein CONLIGDRAFT_277875 [Coniochaeta ligniaria NRRL 30616]